LSHASVRLDLASVEVAERRATFRPVVPMLPRGVVADNITVEPTVVRVTPIVSASPEEKSVFVSPQFVGTPAEGFEPAGWEHSPTQIRVRGGSAQLARLVRVETQPIDISGFDRTTTVNVGVRLPAGVTIVGPQQQIRVRVLIRAAPQGAPAPEQDR
jgi:YbbR domain-containing protein